MSSSENEMMLLLFPSDKSHFIQERTTLNCCLSEVRTLVVLIAVRCIFVMKLINISFVIMAVIL